MSDPKEKESEESQDIEPMQPVEPKDEPKDVELDRQTDGS